MLGREKLLWIGAWIKQDKPWMEQGHARGFAFTAGAAALLLLLQWDESTAMNWKGNNSGPKGQVGKEGPGHGAAWDRDSKQEPGWLWVITVCLWAQRMELPTGETLP